MQIHRINDTMAVGFREHYTTGLFTPVAVYGSEEHDIPLLVGAEQIPGCVEMIKKTPLVPDIPARLYSQIMAGAIIYVMQDRFNDISVTPENPFPKIK